MLVYSLVEESVACIGDGTGLSFVLVNKRTAKAK